MLRQRLAIVAIAAGLFAPQVVAAEQGDPLKPRLVPFVSVNAKNVAIAHVRVIDGTGSAAEPDRTVVFPGGIVAPLGPAGDVRIPAGATIVDGTGKTLLPGYVGMHNHLFTGVGSAGTFQLCRP